MMGLTSMVANSAKPYRQLSLLRRSRMSKTLRKLPSFAPRFASPVVDATFALLFFDEVEGGDCRRLGLYSLAMPFASKSSVTVGSRPRMRRN